MTWQIDSAHSHIYFTARHMMISKVRGQFESFSGEVNYDEENPTRTTVDIQIDTASLNTKEAQRDGHLKSPDFLDVANYPVVRFQSTKVEQTGADSGKLYGNLTIRDITKPVVLDVEYAGQARSPWGTVSAGFSASTTINRKDWGLNWNQTLETGGVLVGDNIQIEIELELVKVAELEAVTA
ncbi:MAG: polyisoprenoid-binding protein [Chloroflexi bacterium]|nr:polyisoprenoid-binding protein [Ardenticatenaceae bacterium]MBL1127267.1 polyisoprenoid-binding protein [Chloroflexota bacterium]NOG33328.1 polyisoprenoid-binding protein [Chloroflexota bacterium]GIK56152.1 MAG: polyisoprenoid-binding protein [Chloroflexota bacterium]